VWFEVRTAAGYKAQGKNKNSTSKNEHSNRPESQGYTVNTYTNQRVPEEVRESKGTAKTGER
jgi:hypothetical protein